jgi:hypothetical protein
LGLVFCGEGLVLSREGFDSSIKLVEAGATPDFIFEGRVGIPTLESRNKGLEIGFPTPCKRVSEGGWKTVFQPLIFGQKSNPRFWKIREAPSRSEGPPLHPSIFFRSQPSSPAHYSPSRQAARASVDFLERRLALPVLLDTLRASRHGTGLPNGPKRPIQ